MINALKKEVYIPIEIKPREFVSQLLLGGELAKIGLRVYLGSKKAIDTLMENKTYSSGVYLYKGGGGTINKFRNLSKQVNAIAVLDQEITPVLPNYDIGISNRFVKGCLKYVSRLYYVGPQARETAINVLEGIDPKNIHAFGWPRIDLWQPSLHHIWKEDIRKIKERFPEPFILFTSNFGCNTKELVEQKSIAVGKRGKRKTKDELVFWRSNFSKNYKKYNEFIDFLKLIDSDPEIPQIIIRPHPSEDHFAWKQCIENFENIHVVYEGDVNPWLLASEGLLHRGCTTALEAAISRKKFASLSNFSIDNSLISIIISKKVKDVNSLKKWIKEDNSKAIEESTHFKLLKKHITFADKNSVHKISRDLSIISGPPIKPSHIFKKSIKPLKFLKLILTKIFQKIYKKPNYLPKLPKTNKMQNGIKLSECSHYLSKMYPNEKFILEEPFNDLVKIECD